MKTHKLLTVLFALLISVCVGVAISSALEISPIIAVAASFFLSIVISFVPMPAGLRVGVLVEAWTGKVVEHFTRAEEGTFLEGIPDFSQYAENDVIHMVDVSGDPTVLIDNNTYPLEIENLADGDIAIKLSKFETKPTRVTDDELYARSYDKMTVVKERHGNKLAEARLDKAIHAIAPQTNSATTPVIKATGAAGADGRKTLTRADIITLRRACDKAGMPKRNRRLVLCNDHINDLLELDQKFKDQYHNYETGSIGKMYGFDVYEYAKCPIYVPATLAIKSFGALPIDGEYEASIAFYVPRQFKCNGSTKLYYSEAAKDPVNKQNLISYTNRFVVLPQKREGACAAIISTK